MRKWRSGSASPCQGEGREFESRLPLRWGSFEELAPFSFLPPEWRNGRRKRLKIARRKACGFESRLRHILAFDRFFVRGRVAFWLHTHVFITDL